MKFKRISILGVGLLGGSIGQGLKTRASGVTVTGYGHRRETIDAAVRLGALDEGYDRVAPAVRGADLVILCSPVGLFRPLLSELSDLLTPATVVTDVGSTKRSVVVAAEELLPQGVAFVGSHPMAGSEKRGVHFARPDLYDGALCILTPTDATDPAALGAIAEFWQTLGMRTCQMSPEAHDRRLADVSHLPHAVAAALVAMQESESIALAGKGFIDTTRIAGGDGTLWRDIFIDNRDNLRQSVERFKQQLDALMALVDAGQAETLGAWLNQCAEKRGT